MSHGELFFLLLLIWLCLSPLHQPAPWTIAGRIILILAVCFNGVLWFIDLLHPTINLG